MKIAYVTTFNAQKLSESLNWAGTGYYIPESFKKQSISVQYIGSLRERLELQIICKIKRHYHRFFSQGDYLKALDPLNLENYAIQVAQELSKIETDVVFSATSAPIAYLDSKQPIVFWADATFENLLNFYPQFTGLCDESIRQGHLMEKQALQRCRLAIYSSEWGAQTAINYYNADPDKVKVVPFGANIEISKTIEEVKHLIECRPRNKCKLLFLGVDWFRKGGNVALEVATELNYIGLDTELTVVGCQPVMEEPLPDFVKFLGFISKSTHEGRDKINHLIEESHFLILPSIADCTPIVFCEANSLGVPCISRKVGGVSTIIKDNLNGKLFNVEADITEYCDYIYQLFTNYSDYVDLATSSFQEYELRLNWSVAGKRIKDLLIDCV
jgi:glycosyltransferase involved in cell wall biosynthesis